MASTLLVSGDDFDDFDDFGLIVGVWFSDICPIPYQRGRGRCALAEHSNIRTERKKKARADHKNWPTEAEMDNH